MINNKIRISNYAEKGTFGKAPGDGNNVNQWRQDQMNAQREKDSQMVGIPAGTSGTGGGAGKDSIPGIGNDTTVKTPYDEVLELLKGGGNYDNSYWEKPQNELLSNSRYAKSRDAEDRKTYLGFINDYKDQNPLETDWGKAIMSQYGLDGDVAAKNEWADAASSNGGNIDSFAEANARRQRLSYLNSGVNAVNEASNQRFSNMIGALEKMGVNTQQLLGISTSNAQSAMDAASNRYSDDTEATIANYNSLISGNSPADSPAMSNDEIQSLMTYLRQVYKDYGESDLLNTAEIYEKNGVSSDVLDSIVSAITGESAATPEPTGEDWYPIPEFRQYFENSDEISGITGLPSWVQQRLRKEAEAKGISATKYAKGILSGDYEYPSWLKQAPYAD